jgi:hypothetical protein
MADRAVLPLHEFSPVGLVRYDAMCTAIEECRRVDEAKDIRDRARALEVYAHQALNTEAERQATEIRIRAERKTGELLKLAKQAGQRHSGRGDHKAESRRATPLPTLSEMRISKDQSSQWQELAEIPKAEFERVLAIPGAKPSTESLIMSRRAVISPMPPTPPHDALWVWGQLRDFEREAILSKSAHDIFQSMPEHMREDALRLGPVLRDWLEGLQ